MCHDGALANASTLSCFTSFHLESNEGIPLSDRCWHDGACPQKRQFHWELPTVNSHLGTFPPMHCGHRNSLDGMFVNQLCPKRSFLLLISSVYSISLYQKLEPFTRPPWEWQLNVDETKYPAFRDKTSRREAVYAFACV